LTLFLRTGFRLPDKVPLGRVSMQTNPEKSNNNTVWLGIGAGLAAIGASVCCVGPLLLVSLGIGGAWISTLTSMDATRPFFIALTLIFLVLGVRRLYLLPDLCQEGDACAQSCVRRRQRIIFWIGSTLILLLLAFPWVAPYFLL
jgi:mercuric ion transport protein